MGWRSLNHLDEISDYSHLNSKLELNPTNCSLLSTFKNHRISMWSQQSTCIESLLDLFQILSFVILSMDLACRQTLTLLALKGICLVIRLLCDNSPQVVFNRNVWWHEISNYLGYKLKHKDSIFSSLFSLTIQKNRNYSETYCREISINH